MVAVIEMQLEDKHALDVVSQLRDVSPHTQCTLLTECGNYEIAIAAVRAGFTDLASKPLPDGELLDIIRRAQDRALGFQTDCPRPEAIKRWSDLILRVLRAPNDPKTRKEWGRVAAVSEGTVKNWCRAASINAKQSLLFARVLRALYRHEVMGIPPEDSLDIVDRRTLRRLRFRSGGDNGQLPTSTLAFLDTQQLIVRDDAVADVRTALSLFYDSQKVRPSVHHRAPRTRGN
jgi:hypothetical protein